MRRKILSLFFSLGLVGAVTTGCVVQETVVRRPPCVGGVWIGGHYDRGGFWHRAHWRCPGVVEVIE